MGFAIRWAVGQFHMVLSTLRWWLPHVVVWGAQSPSVVPHYPLVNSHITMENHHVEWENPRFRMGHFQ